MKRTVFLIALSAATASMAPSAAQAQLTTYTSQSSFASATSGNTTYGFSFSGNTPLASSYALGPVTFMSSMLVGYNDAYGAPYLADNNYGSAVANTYTISSTTSALGLFLGSYHGKATYTYTVNGATGSVTAPAPNGTTFLGFTNLSGPVSVTFNVAGGSSGSNNELDVIRFITGNATEAVPEPGTWAMMILGIGAIGCAMRRRLRASEVRFDAKIKKISAGEIA